MAAMMVLLMTRSEKKKKNQVETYPWALCSYNFKTISQMMSSSDVSGWIKGQMHRHVITRRLLIQFLKRNFIPFKLPPQGSNASVRRKKQVYIF
jgi:hypothetical protein